MVLWEALPANDVRFSINATSDEADHSYQLFASRSSDQCSSCVAIDEGAMHRPSREVHPNFLAAEDYVIIHLPPSRNFTFFCVLITMALILIINCSVYAIASWSFIRCPDGSSSLFR
jgi:hypothetical protein